MKKFEFLDLQSEAERAGITEARLKAKILTEKLSAFIHVSDLFTVMDGELFLPAWSTEFEPIATWIDIGCALAEPNINDEVGQAARYWLTGWVMIESSLTAKLIQGVRSRLDREVIWLMNLVGANGYPLWVVPHDSDAGPFEVPELTREDLYFIEPIEGVKDAPVRESARRQASLLHVVAAMKELLLEKEGGNFPSQAKVIDQLVARYGAADGLSQRNLEKVFAEATRAAGNKMKAKE